MEFNCSNNSESVAELFRQLEDKHNMAMIPAVVMMVIFAVVGLVGNILVLVVYSKKVRLNPTKVLIMTIASFDLVGNVAGIPSEISIMMDTWTFNRPGMCKFKSFFTSFTTIGGACSLCVVAAIRYRKVCRPYGWQFTVKHAIIASIGAAVASFILSSPDFILVGVRSRQTPCPNINGSECFTSDEYISTIWNLLYNILFILLYISSCVYIIVLYRFIGVTAYKHSKRHGVSGEVTTTQNNINSSPKGLSSSDNERIVSVEKQVKPPSVSWSSRVKSGNLLTTNVHILDCCKGNEENGNSVNDRPMSMKMKTFTTSVDTLAEDKTTESTNTELDYSNCEEEEENVRDVVTDDQNLDVTCLSSADSSLDGSDENIQEYEVARSRDRRDTRPNNLAVSEDHNHKQKHLEIPTINFNQKNNSGTKKTTSKSQTSAKKVAKRRPLGRMTAMLIIISAIFIAGYLPYLALIIVKSRFSETYASLNMAELIVFNLFYRLYFVNSAVNPIVYSFCNLNFRKECFKFLKCRRRL